MWQEFKKFAFKGNVMDMAVGVIIGGAFGSIVNSLVNDIIMPFFGFLTAGMDFKSLKWVLSPAELAVDGTVVKAEAAILYGSFIQNIVNFLIIAFSIFFMIRLVSKASAAAAERMKKDKAPEAPAPQAPKAPTEAELLAEIRDLLKGREEADMAEDAAES
ncbi:MAG: large-conductance mechanosensitive channel protein MscL [Candidatus Merdivicinus sp.]|jgi:large conductance mechanosensitive channel